MNHLPLSSNSTTTTTTTTVFPLSRIRNLIKEDEDIKHITNDAVFIVSKAAELFLQKFSWTVYEVANSDKRKIIQYKDLVYAIDTVDEYFFLEDIVPAAPKYVTPTLFKAVYD
ncbi:hypothetical protein HMI54_014832 [Coelomomyces lativittatus]|nr:hypothetical protein HMI55_002677 [Coelomomyces lativittatus]KAJ1510056.1 hypothetical protein HMI56_006521 [Coelomomyces lativittatus]KAJ1513630.1 hypothetical protein HMI54_014832 [Coelomomyces lativittatus]